MQYNPRSFIRQVPNSLLASFFSRYAGFSGFDWTRLSVPLLRPNRGEKRDATTSTSAAARLIFSAQ
jgi:hypothetical protein